MVRESWQTGRALSRDQSEFYEEYIADAKGSFDGKEDEELTSDDPPVFEI